MILHFLLGFDGFFILFYFFESIYCVEWQIKRLALIIFVLVFSVLMVIWVLFCLIFWWYECVNVYYLVWNNHIYISRLIFFLLGFDGFSFCFIFFESICWVECLKKRFALIILVLVSSVLMEIWFFLFDFLMIWMCQC